jgi:hypothetical protein
VSAGRRTLLFAAAAAAALACSNGDDAPGSSGGPEGGSGDCPNDVPAVCPPGAPTFAKDIAPIFTGTCATCHTPGGRQSSRLLTTYDQIYPQRGAVLSQVSACRMPPRDGPALAPEARKALLAWLVCGAKND